MRVLRFISPSVQQPRRSGQLVTWFGKRRHVAQVLRFGLIMTVAAAVGLNSGRALAESVGPNSPSVVVDDSSAGSAAWNAPGNATASDDSRTYFTEAIGVQSHYLKAADFGFSIPSGATINGIVVEIEKWGSSNILDAAVRIVKGGTIGSTDRSIGSSWPFSDSYVTHGNSSDLWGETWTAADINASTFGVAIRGISAAGISTGYIDHVRITVYYTLGGSVQSTTSDGGPPAWLRLLRQRNAEREAEILPREIRITVFHDWNGDGQQQSGERSGLTGLPFVVQGRNVLGEDVNLVGRFGSGGKVALRVSPSDASGYVLSLDSASPEASRYVMTLSPLRFQVSRSTEPMVVVPVRPAEMVRYAPCYRIDDGDADGLRFADDGLELLRRMHDAESRRPLESLAVGTELISRRDFLRLLARAACWTESPPDGERSQAALPPDVTDASDTALIGWYSERQIPVLRETGRGAFADLASPVSQEEASRVVAAVLAWLADGTEDKEKLMSAGDAIDPLLKANHPTSGFTWPEAAKRIARAAFRIGTISLEKASSSGTLTTTPLLQLPKRLHWSPQRPCLSRFPDRASELTFSDVRPGDTGFEMLRGLASLGATNGDERILWLLTGTARPSEFGVPQGRSSVHGDTPTSVIETLRAVLLAACLPWETQKQVRQPLSRVAGTTLTRVVVDAIGGLPRNATFASRVVYRAQDHLPEYDLSLFAFAERLLASGPENARDVYSLDEAAELFASALLMASVREGRLSRLEAEGLTRETYETVRDWLLVVGPGRTRGSLLRRIDLLRFLDAIVDVPRDDEEESVGELWMERLL